MEFFFKLYITRYNFFSNESFIDYGFKHCVQLSARPLEHALFYGECRHNPELTKSEHV